MVPVMRKQLSTSNFGRDSGGKDAKARCFVPRDCFTICLRMPTCVCLHPTFVRVWMIVRSWHRRCSRRTRVLGASLRELCSLMLVSMNHVRRMYLV